MRLITTKVTARNFRDFRIGSFLLLCFFSGLVSLISITHTNWSCFALRLSRLTTSFRRQLPVQSAIRAGLFWLSEGEERSWSAHEGDRRCQDVLHFCHAIHGSCAAKESDRSGI